jgi:molecular chaperone DnaJ
MDFYIVLGLGRDASLGEIKRAYRRLARRYHPDINPGDRLAAAQFRQIAEAYETLSDPDRRRRYDSGSVQRASDDQRTYGFEGFDFSVSVGGQEAPTFGDLFADVLRREPQPDPNEAQAGADLHHTLSLGFEEAIRGGQRQIVVTRQERCRLCAGAGRLGTAESLCSHCQGTGAVRAARGHMVFSKPCVPCRGTGRQVDARCPACGGHQTQMRVAPMTVAVPPGVADGDRIRAAGFGHAGRNGGPDGDLFITVCVAPHPLFRREGDDLHLTVPIAIHEAALGAKIPVPTLDGHARLRLPPGTQSGQRFRLRERGAPSTRDGRRGDLVVEVRLVLPKLLDERSKELLREFGRINGSDVRADIYHRGGEEHAGDGGNRG